MPEPRSTRLPGSGAGAKLPKRPCGFIIGAGGEIEVVRIPAIAAIAEDQAPEAVDDDRVAIDIFESAQKCTGSWIEGINLAIAEVAHQQVIAEFTKTLPEPGPGPRGN